MNLYLLDIDTTVTRVTFLVLIPFVVAFSFIVFIFYRRNRENTLRRKQLELELKALRAQINPHFIFNCLNSIHYCIQNNNNDIAGRYLLQFSYLTRRILENSSKFYISLEEDLDILRAYLDLEQLRSGHRFKYEIMVSNNIDPANTSVPMLIAQPIIENIIWHGMSATQSDGHIRIAIDSPDDMLIYSIVDNGKIEGNRPAQHLPGKKQSLGRSLVLEQLEAISELENRDAYMTVNDQFNEQQDKSGSITEIHLPYLPCY